MSSTGLASVGLLGAGAATVGMAEKLLPMEPTQSLRDCMRG